jgi:L-rhamnose mutarotase
MNKLVILSLFFSLMLTACQTAGPVAPVYGPTNPTPSQAAQASVQYYASMVELKPGMEEKYRQLHSNVWPEVRAAIRKANIRNYNIYVVELDGKRYLVSYFEYIGTNPKADFAGMAKDPTTRDKWWPLTNACQIRLPGTPPGQQWKPLEQVMHID